jgi:hypothetical protein
MMAKYTDMTDEEYDALDEELTRNPPKLGPNGTGWLSQRELKRIGMSDAAIKYLVTKAMAEHKSTGQLINEMVDKEMSCQEAATGSAVPAFA